MFSRAFFLMCVAVSLAALSGCCSDCTQSVGPTFTPAPLVPRAACPASPLPPRFDGGSPPAAVVNPPPTYLPPASQPPAAPPPPAPVAAPPAPAPSVQGAYSIPIPPDPGWRPSLDPGVHLSPPEAVAPEKPSEAARLPQGPEPPVASIPQPPPVNAPVPAPPVPAPPAPAAPMPTPMPLPKGNEPPVSEPTVLDIPQFAQVKQRVATGQKPFADGIAWLKTQGYKAVLHVHKPGEDEAAARRQFEMRGLKYLSLEISPETLTKTKVDQFNKIVADEANLPLFVFDQDSSLAGGLWYLHFRLVERADDAKARAEAGRLGFREDRNDEHRTMWVAVQNFLKNK